MLLCTMYEGFRLCTLSQTCSDKTRPPTRQLNNLLFFYNAAELKRRFRSHTINHARRFNLQSWVGGRSFKFAHRLVPDQNGNNQSVCAHDHDPPSHLHTRVCDIHTSTLCSSPKWGSVLSIQGCAECCTESEYKSVDAREKVEVHTQA